jgi:hypothetical protein
MSESSLEIRTHQQHKNLTYRLELCGKCRAFLENNYCTCGTFIGDIDPVVYVSIFTTKQISNHGTRIKISKVGKLIYIFLKEQAC